MSHHTIELRRTATSVYTIRIGLEYTMWPYCCGYGIIKNFVPHDVSIKTLKTGRSKILIDNHSYVRDSDRIADVVGCSIEHVQKTVYTYLEDMAYANFSPQQYNNGRLIVYMSDRVWPTNFLSLLAWADTENWTCIDKPRSNPNSCNEVGMYSRCCESLRSDREKGAKSRQLLRVKQEDSDAILQAKFERSQSRGAT